MELKVEETNKCAKQPQASKAAGALKDDSNTDVLQPNLDINVPGQLVLGINGANEELSPSEKRLQRRVVNFLALCGFVLTEIPAIMKSGIAFLFKKNCKALVIDISRGNEPTYDAVCLLGCDYWFGKHLDDVHCHFAQVKNRIHMNDANAVRNAVSTKNFAKTSSDVQPCCIDVPQNSNSIILANHQYKNVMEFDSYHVVLFVELIYKLVKSY
jgi:hypothetical protein